MPDPLALAPCSWLPATPTRAGAVGGKVSLTPLSTWTFVRATNAALFAYVADWRNGLKVIQLISPAAQRNFYGFSPPPKPELIAWARTPSPALALSKGLDRDRAVDETGHQIAVFGRLGSRPFTRPAMEPFFTDGLGRAYRVTDAPDLTAWLGRRPSSQ